MTEHMSVKEVTEVVIASVKKSFPTECDEIIPTIRWDSLNRCYFFQRWGMYIGIEEDGYIHS